MTERCSRTPCAVPYLITSGTGQRCFVGAASVSEKYRVCESSSSSPPSASRARMSTSGWPGSLIQAFAIDVTSWPDDSSSACQKSSAEAFASACRFR